MTKTAEYKKSDKPTLPCCINHFYKAHPVVNNKLLSIRVFYRRIICLCEKRMRAMHGSAKHKVPSHNNIPLRSGGAARSVSARWLADSGLTNEAVEGELEGTCQEERGRWEGWRTWTAKAVFPTPPSPNTATRQQSISGKEGGIRGELGGREGMKRTLNHDGWGARAQKSERGK